MDLPAISVVCVYNDEHVRSQCLDASIAVLDPDERFVEYLPIDNRGQVHSSAGSALNEGVRRASANVVAFVHQDVVLHDLDALLEAAETLRSRPEVGVLGAIGVDQHGTTLGLLRDRIALIGESRQEAAEVQSIDEVLFMARRDVVLKHPVTELAVYAWHAYAVEYSLRLREIGLNTFTVDLGVTHNSRSINVANLWGAHRRIADDYVDRLPIHTTCGTITKEGPEAERVSVAGGSHRWRLRRLLECIRVLPIRVIGRVDVVLADIRYELDEVAAAIGATTVRVVHCGRAILDSEAKLFSGLTSVQRYGKHIRFDYHNLRETTPSHVEPDNSPVVYLNLDWLSVLRIASSARAYDISIGFHRDLRYFVFVGANGSSAIQYRYAVPAAFMSVFRPRPTQPLDAAS